ncbi:MAG: hypothetical protein ABW252_18395 [Polyangiales bacterium]
MIFDQEERNDKAPGSDAGRAPTEPLPDMDTRLEQARDAAQRRRRELGLPDLPENELESPRRGKRSGKRSKNHGQFMRGGSR